MDARLVYPRMGTPPYPLDDPDATLEKLAKYLATASASFAAGKALPGPAVRDNWYDLDFALPGGAKESYVAGTLQLVELALSDLAPLWKEP